MGVDVLHCGLGCGKAEGSLSYTRKNARKATGFLEVDKRTRRGKLKGFKNT